MTKFDSLNLTAPHTMREIEQTECETAAAMRARQIAAMIEEDRWLDGDAGRTIPENRICWICKKGISATQVSCTECETYDIVSRVTFGDA